MEKQEQIVRMANTCNNYHSCALCPYNPEDISRFIGDKWIGGCPNYDRKLVYAMSKGYRKVPDGAVVLLIGENNQALDEKTIEYFVKHNDQIRKETAREILDLIAKIVKEEYGGEPPCNFNCNDEYMFDNCNEFCCEYCNTPDNEKNYERCWIEFFKSKMKKYGVGVEE